MLREYVISEAMHALGIPTTRSLAVAATGETVYRETPLPGAILTRVAASHLRVGTFEFAAATGFLENLRAVADYTLRRHYPELADAEQPYAALLKAVMDRQAALVARWQNVGFVHGVMNTDNMALSGETIDYGPCAFLDVYDPGTLFSSIDAYGRYAYENQPKIAHWNLSRFASALLPLLHPVEEEAVALANEILRPFPDLFQAHWLSGLRAKLGLFNAEPEDAQLADGLLSLMLEQKLDFTNTFRDLSADFEATQSCAASPEMEGWLAQWRERLARQDQPVAEAQALMRRNNPSFIPRNHKVEEALSAAMNADLNPVLRLLEVLARPFDYKLELPEFSASNGAPYQTFCGT
jgi:uncharacterized protein YdiU (UPF0061 family)